MIQPRPEDIGKEVKFHRPQHSFHDTIGQIVKITPTHVVVRFGSRSHAVGCDRKDLRWLIEPLPELKGGLEETPQKSSKWRTVSSFGQL